MHLTHLGPYELGKPLGKGGMGSVYEARDTRTAQRVAVKALTPHLASAEGFRERFEAEIESLQTLRHDGIVRMYGYGEQDGVLFYSMELIEGTSLEEELKAGRRFNWREVSDIAIQLCLALRHAHDHGIIHRDIKPANVMLLADERVKLADFGIARLFGSTQLTTAGGVLGTADYMSPEQADGRPVSARCDQYSLGGVMYALLTGRPPFRAKNLPHMLQLQRFAEPEPVRRYAPDTPEQLDRLVMQLLAKEPADRFPNMQVLARHLQAMVKALSRPVTKDPSAADVGESGDEVELDLEHSLEIAATQAEAMSSSRRGDSNGPAMSQDAATLAADDPTMDRNRSATLAGGASSSAGVGSIVSRRAGDGTTRFTTVEEEDARRRAELQRSWLVTGLQIAVLVAVLAGLGGAAYYLMRPPTADELYRTIAARADVNDEDNGESLRQAQREIERFLARFPDDPRAAEFRDFEQRLALDRVERDLQLVARRRGIGSADLLPVERLYLQAANLAYDSPAEAARLLESLIELYGVAAATNDDDVEQRRAACVQLAERRLADLRADAARQTDEQLATLRERLAAAERLSDDEPEQAAAMYRAIIELYDGQEWAAEIVAEARRRLEGA